MLYLNEPLAAGNYRLMLSISVFNTSDALDYVYEFAVVPYGDVPEPQWDTSRLSPSSLVSTNQSVDITMRIENSVLNEGNTSLVLAITSGGAYAYEFGVAYGVEVLLDGKWYSVPFAHNAFTLQAIVASPGFPDSIYELNVGPVFQCGVLPAGQYRLVKSFDLRDQSASVVTFLANEYAFAEFTVEKTLDWVLLP